ncbi:Glutamyl-tRNA(Gln) amidotransferase subunit A [Marinomonas aquimarina]|uniref:Glutamyl-tRNA(Gln) amidotransferase subunit A n=1 Tax=Marinomonas aquimarina TaxID=295068 RepID=A0A1A8T990_9GAMM|nr:amidase [Marinomonas aquimarina]SBS29286.1 Glutamyl-tRNA(Gln) amidotransferase subunit A [Marinomonas aquimarina]
MKHAIVQNPFLRLPEHFSPTVVAASEQPLAGMRLAVKDLFHMQGLPTTAGNPTWLATHDQPTVTASSVNTLLSAGAQFVGKTITDELAYSLNGQNIHYGTPENPITPERLPGGSSSGSAVAVSGHLAEIGLGTDTGGSIRVPSSYNGLFGLRPTHGVIAMDNMVALAPSFDTVGFMTRSLDELIKVAQTLLPAQRPVLAKTLIAKQLINQVEHKDALLKQLDTWSAQGKLSIDKSLEIDPVYWQTGATFRTLQGAEIWQTHGDWITQNDPDFAPDIASRVEWTKTISADDVSDAKAQQAKFREWIDEQLEGAALILPTTPGRSPLLTMQDNELAEYRNQLLELTAIAGLCGLPQLHLPVCDIDGAPCGLSLIGPRGSDLSLLALAKDLME